MVRCQMCTLVFAFSSREGDRRNRKKFVLDCWKSSVSDLETLENVT